MNQLFDPNPGLRTADEWRGILSKLVTSLSSFLGLEFEATSWFVHDDRTGDLSSSNSVDIKANIPVSLSLQMYGVLCLTINFDEAVWVSCDLLLFASGHRLLGSQGMDLIEVTYDERGWTNRGWIIDANYEWEAYSDNSRWE